MWQDLFAEIQSRQEYTVRREQKYLYLSVLIRILVIAMLRIFHWDCIELPQEFSVGAAYPNPFNPTCIIPMTIPGTGEISLQLYNIIGQVAFQEKRVFNAGSQVFNLNASKYDSQLSSGI